MKTNNIRKMLAVVVAVALLAFTAMPGGAITYQSNCSSVVSKTADYTATSSDCEIDVDATSAAVTITLPAISSLSGFSAKSLVIKKTDSSTNFVTITANSADNIGDGADGGNRVLVGQNDYIILEGHGTDWTVTFQSPYVWEIQTTGAVNINGTYTSPANSVGTTELDNGAVTPAKIDNSDSDAQVLIGQGTGAPAWKTMSGDGTITNALVLDLATNAATSSEIFSNAVAISIGIAVGNGEAQVTSGSKIIGAYLSTAIGNGYFINSVSLSGTTLSATVNNGSASAIDHGAGTITVVVFEP